MNQPRGIVILSTAPKEEEAARLARTLVEERLVACVNIVPGVRSIFSWQGKVQDDPELLLVMKTTDDRAEQAVARLKALHSYSVPEAVALPIVAGNEAYLGWLAEVTR